MPYDFTSALHLAVLQNDVAVVDMLLKFGGDLSLEMQTSEWDDDDMLDVSTVHILEESRRRQLGLAYHLFKHDLENHVNAVPDSKSIVRLLRLKLEQGLSISAPDRARCFWIRAAIARHGGALTDGLIEAYFQPGHFDLWRIQSWPWGSAEPMEFQALVAAMPGRSNTSHADVETGSSGASHSDNAE